MYRDWLKKVAAIFLASTVVISGAYKFLVINRCYYNIDFSLSKQVDTLVVGSSHLQMGFDDSNHDNVENYSVSGMPYFLTFNKVEKLLSANRHVKKLVVSLSPIHVSPYGDSCLFTDNGLSRDYAFTFLPLIEDYSGLGHKRFSLDFALAYSKYNLGVPFNYMDDVRLFTASFNGPIPFSTFRSSGRFEASSTVVSHTDSFQKKADVYFKNKTGSSPLAIRTIFRIAALSDAKDVELYIVNMPIHEQFRALIPKQYIQEHGRLVAEIIATYPNVTYVDYSRYPLLAGDWMDGDHVNVSGATRLLPAIEADILGPQ